MINSKFKIEKCLATYGNIDGRRPPTTVYSAAEQVPEEPGHTSPAVTRRDAPTPTAARAASRAAAPVPAANGPGSAIPAPGKVILAPGAAAVRAVVAAAVLAGNEQGALYGPAGAEPRLGRLRAADASLRAAFRDALLSVPAVPSEPVHVRGDAAHDALPPDAAAALPVHSDSTEHALLPAPAAAVRAAAGYPRWSVPPALVLPSAETRPPIRNAVAKTAD